MKKSCKNCLHFEVCSYIKPLQYNAEELQSMGMLDSVPCKYLNEVHEKYDILGEAYTASENAWYDSVHAAMAERCGDFIRKERLMSKLNIDAPVSVEDSFTQLTTEYKKAAVLRKKADAVIKKLKAWEEEIKTTISNKLVKEGLRSVKTDVGTLSNYTFETVKTNNAEAFAAWLAEDFAERSYLLLDTPYSKPKLIDFAGTEKELPPGVEWYREIKLSIKK